MAIPISVDVNVIPGVLEASGDAVDLNGLILSTSIYMPTSTVKKFTTADDVSTYFGPNSTEYSMAEIYFKGYDNTLSLPGALYFYRYDESDAAASVRSASLKDLTSAQIKLLSGTLIAEISGTATSADVDLSSAGSVADVVTALNTAFSDSITFVYDSDISAIIATGTETGSGYTLSFQDGTVSTGLGLTANSGAELSSSSAYVTPYVAMSNITESNQSFATYTTTFYPSEEQAVYLSQFASDSSYRYAYVMLDDAEGALTDSSTSCLAYVVSETYDYSNVIPVYGDQTHTSNVMGFGASLNFDLTNGRRSLKYRSLSGLLTTVSTSSNRTALTDNAYNFYGEYGQNNISENYWAQGTITGAYKWIDAFLGQVWLNANLQGAILDLFMSEIYLPYGTAGRVAIEAACTDVINQFKTWGGITTNTTLTSTQIQAIYNTVGTDVSSTLANQGYYLYIGPFTAAMRSARTSPVCVLWYTDGGVIQNLTIDSIEVQ